jgi:HK97 gp10 family phage protein
VKFDIETKGFKELNNLLKELPKNVENKVLMRSAVGAARAGAKVIKEAAPVGDEPSEASKKYGSLKKNIRAGRAKARKRSAREALIHTRDAFWGWFYEFGNPRQPARPWFVPAFKSASTRMLDEIKSRLGKGIEDEAKKLK